MRTDTKEQLGTLNNRVDRLGKLDKLEKNVNKTNVQLAENTRALMKFADFNDRIVRLENTVFKKAG